MNGPRTGSATHVRLRVNGTAHDIVAPHDTPLLYILRNDLGLNGPKYGCGLGQCGACTILVEGRALRSCVLPLAQVAEREILTLEGIGTQENMHPVQMAFVSENAAQCGYCLNGMIMTVVALLKGNPAPDDATIKQKLRHNLCRCGAHMEILAAVKRAAAALNDMTNEGPTHA